MKDRCNECRYKMERHGIVDGEDVYYCDICGIYQSYPLEEEALLAAEKKNCGCGKDPCVTYGAESEKKPEKDHNCIACGHHSAHIKMGDDRFCYDCYHYAETFYGEITTEPMTVYRRMGWKQYYDGLEMGYLHPMKTRMQLRPDENIGGTWGMGQPQIWAARKPTFSSPLKHLSGSEAKQLFEIDIPIGTRVVVGYDVQILDSIPIENVRPFYMGDEEEYTYMAETFNSYKVAPELSSYTVDELVASKAGPQGSAAYDEMVYDPIAQDRQSAESFSLPKTLLLFGAMAAGLGFGVFLTKKLGDITPETSDEGGA